MTQPKRPAFVSVVVPVYNGAAWLPRCIKGLAAQTYPNVEFLMVDNRSTDDTPNILAQIKKADSRFRTAYCEAPGASYARNVGIEQALGDYIFFCDADDVMEPGCIDLLAAAAVAGGCDICFSNIFNGPENRHRLQDPSKSGNMLRSGAGIHRMVCEKLPSYIIHFPFKLYRAAWLRAHGLQFDPTVSFGEDLLFNLDAFSKAERVQYLDVPLYRYLPTPAGMNNRYRANMIDIKVALFLKIKAYAEKNNCFDDRLYKIFFKDLFAMLLNDSSRDECKRALALPLVKEMADSGVRRHLNAAERVVLLCIKFHLIFALQAAVDIWKRREFASKTDKNR